MVLFMVSVRYEYNDNEGTVTEHSFWPESSEKKQATRSTRDKEKKK